MKIARDLEHTAAIIDSIRLSFTKDAREGIHLSDLLNPRRSAWQRVLPLPPTDADILFWLAGRGHEDALGRVSNLAVATEGRWEWGLPSDAPVMFRNDFVDDGEPIEFKTRRANLAAPGEEAVIYDTYLDQLRGYCALLGKRRGRLVVFSLLEGKSATDPLKPTAPEIVSYTVEFTHEELGATRRELAERAYEFQVYLVADSIAKMASPTPKLDPPSHLPLCKAWMCGKMKKNVIQKAWCSACLKSVNHGEGHAHRAMPGAFTPEVVEWGYEPRCKYYGVCQPQLVDPQRGAR